MKTGRGIQSAEAMLRMIHETIPFRELPRLASRGKIRDRQLADLNQISSRLPAIAAVLLATLFSGPAHACQCGRTSVAEAVKSAELVFEGAVMGLWPVLIRMPAHEMPTQRYTFRVLRTWKGTPGREIYLVNTGGSCSSAFEAGKIYLVFASPRGTSPYYSSSICSPTKLTAKAVRELRELGPGTVVQPSFAPPSESSVHRFGRRVMAAALMAVTWLRVSRTPFFETELGVWLAFTLSLTLSAFGYIALRLFVRQRRRWRLMVIVLATLLTLSVATLLGFGYWYTAAHPWFRQLVE